AIAQFLLDFTHASPWSTMVAIYVATVIFTNLITNNAAAVLMFPFALNIAGDLNVSFMPFAIAIMMGASSSYATPIGYQTNLMVMGPGGYRFSDYFRLGIPLTVVAGIITVVTIPMVWSF
ncbi:MAG: SLC13 family permease, partial [Pseudomonadota bacterium]|nr:SLC13 family permease [Pseudomonadota bacterium]